MKKHRTLLFLLCFIVIAFLLRSRMFLYGDVYFLPDQGRDMLLVKSIVADHKLTLIGGHAGLGGLFHGPLWWYLLTLSFTLSGGNPYWTLVPVYEIVSLGIIISSFFIAKKLYGEFIAVAVAGLLTFSETFISTIQFTSNSQVMPLIYVFYLFSIITYIRGSNRSIILSWLFIGLGIHFESAFAIMLVPTTVFAVYYRKIKPDARYIILSIVVFLVSISNFIFFDLRHGFLMTKSILSLLSGHTKTSMHQAAYSSIFSHLTDRLEWFSITLRSGLYTQNMINIMLFISIVTGGIIFSYQEWIKNHYRDKIREIMFMAISIVIVYVGYFLYPFPLQAHYVQSLTIPVIFSLAFCIEVLSTKIIGRVVVVFFVLGTLIPAMSTIITEYTSKTVYSPTTEGSYRNQLAAVDYVYKDASGKPFGYFIYDAPIVTYGMDYLFWWRGKKFYHYIPTSTKLPITYLIMLPSPVGDLQAHNFWKKNMVKTNGKIMKETLLPGNIIIQKLAIDSSEGPANPNYYQNLIFR